MYWDKRVSQYGHTGWSDYSIYFYDQKVRLNLLRFLLENRKSEKSQLLDYGCGTGDFSRLASQYYQNIIGTDISNDVLEIAKKRNGKESNINFLQLNEKIFHFDYDCILSITVLQHIMSDVDLEQLVYNFYMSTKLHKGRLIILETVGDSKLQKSSYLKIRSFEALSKIFQKYGFFCEECYNFYDPICYENGFYNIFYHKNLLVRLLKKFANHDIYLAKILLKKFAECMVGNFNGIVSEETKTKIMIFRNKG